MLFCKNRPEDFTAHSKFSDAYPSQCFYDVILVPVPTWLLLFLLLILGIVSPRLSKSRKSRAAPERPKLKLLGRVLRLLPHIAYYFCIIIIILMQSIELARLVELDLGIGLIPVVYAGCLIAAIVHGTDSFRGKLVFGKFANLCFWLATIAVAGTKATAIHKFGRDVEENPLARHDTAYSIDHQITDLVILAIFAAGAFIFEVLVLVLGFVGRRKYGAGGGATVGAGKA